MWKRRGPTETSGCRTRWEPCNIASAMRTENDAAGNAGQPNWANQTIWTGDNLSIMRGMNSECVDLIYLDPPFNSQVNYAAPIGSKAAGAAFKDTWTLDDVDVEWINLIESKHPNLFRVLLATTTDSDKSYLVYMAMRILEMHRILKPKGSIYLHCNHEQAHYLKLVMDAIFGRKNFKNDLIWCYGGGGRGGKNTARHFPRNHDNILYYAKDKRLHHHEAIQEFKQHLVDDLPSHIRKDERGYFKTAPRGNYTDESVEQLRLAGRIHETQSGNIRIRYDLDSRDDMVLEPRIKGSVWNIPDMMHAPRIERQRYPTQKPLALLRPIIESSSESGDVVLDPFCGCASFCIAAQGLDRKWAGIDISPKAGELVKMRMRYELGLFFQGTTRTDIPKRTDMGPLPRYNSTENRRWLYGYQEGHCQGCGAHFEARHLEVDHIIAKAKGGTDHRDNLQLLYANCNRIKGDRGMDYLMAKLKMTLRPGTRQSATL